RRSCADASWACWDELPPGPVDSHPSRQELPVGDQQMASVLRALVVLLVSLNGDAVRRDPPIVHVDGGAIRGTVLEHDGGELFAFRGIPFAAPPVGTLRWRPPQPVVEWEGLRACTDFGPACPQPGDGEHGSAYPRQSEDCLHLNVWTPTLDEGARLPVMV